MNVKPISEHIIVKPLENETVTSGGIIIPDTVEKERSERGEVIAVGPGAYLDSGEQRPVAIAPGQTVIFKKYAPDEVEVDGQTYLIIREDDVMAIIE